LPHLLLTLETLRSQRGVAIECIVVEQDPEPTLRAILPSWVRYHPAPLPQGETLYNRSAAFNAGSRLAQGALLILHDHDLLLPQAYAAEAWERYRSGFEVIQPGRFIFYLDRTSSETMMAGQLQAPQAAVERVVENFAGGSLAIGRSVFEELGGMDEDFAGWGGEDNEFLDRCLTRNAWRFGYLPLLHLWHPSRAERDADRNPALALLRRKRERHAADRIRLLREKHPTAFHASSR
jgi:GT2 family glycosyltransferase